MRDFIERLRAKPEHVRHRIAFFTSAGVTGVVAFGWLIALASSGTLALSSPSNAAQGGNGFAAVSDVSRAVSETGSEFSNLLGAAGSLQAGTSSVPALTIVDGDVSSTVQKSGTADERTVIPF